MLRKDFQAILSRAPVLLDGATGTYLQSHGMPKGVCPEQWALDHRDILFEMHRSYYLAGTDVAVTCTFGANAEKLGHFGIGADQVGAVNRDLARIAVEARDSVLSSMGPERPSPLVSGDLGPTGRFLVPAGDLGVEELVAMYRSQVRGLLDGGVDLFSIETMMDLGQTRAALRAIRLECDLPVIATLTFDAAGKTLAGNGPLECAIALEAAGADAIGANCSTGPKDMGRVLAVLAGHTALPIVCKPNAGLPRIEEGQTVFDMGPDAFTADILPFVQSGLCRLIGGCCGTTPVHIATLSRTVRTLDPVPPASPQSPARAMISSARRTVEAPRADEVHFIPVTDPACMQDDVMDAMEEAGAVIGLDFLPAGNSPDISDYVEALGWVQTVCTTPLVFRSHDAGLLQALVEVYPGRAGIVTGADGTFEGAARLG